MMSTRDLLLVGAIALMAGACDCGEGQGDGGDGGVDPGVASSRAKLRFKEGRRMANDFARALGLDTGALCRELGQYSCVEEVHTVALLGVEPYQLGLYEPLVETAVTTPIAVERVAIAACSERVDRDLADAVDAVIYKGLPIEGGAIADIEDPAVGEAIDALYKRALQRRATAAEIEHHRQLYRDIAALGGDEPARAWAKGSCFATLTALENLFY
jgi:hypothetical protein